MAKKRRIATNRSVKSQSPIPSIVEGEVSQLPDAPLFTKSQLVIALIILGITAGVYCRTLDYPMVFDDKVYLEANPLFTESRSFGYAARFVEFANEAGKRRLDPDLSANLILRPVAYLTFHINYVFDTVRPHWYRAVNIAIHLGNTVLLFAFLRLLLDQASKTRTDGRDSAPFVAASCAAWFAFHPLATESVTYIVQRFTSLAAFFYLLTLVLHLGANLIDHIGLRRVLRVLTALVLVIGMLVKECTVTAPLMAVFLDWVILGTGLRLALRRALLLLICMPIVPALVVLTAWAQNGCEFSWRSSIHLANVKDRSNEHSEYAITQLTVLPHYLRMILWPTGQNLDPDWPRYTSLLQWQVVHSILIIGGLLGGTWFWQRRQSHDLRPALIFAGVVWFFGSIIVSSGLVPLPDMLAEHRTYIPSIGILVSVASLLHWLHTFLLPKHKLVWLPHSIAAVCAVGLVAATVARNEVWSSPVRLWEDSTAKSPNKFRAWGNLGSAYAAVGRLTESAECYERARSLENQFLPAYINLTVLYNKLQQWDKALSTCVEAERANPAFGRVADIIYNAAVANLALGEIDHGEVLLNAILKDVPNHRDSHIALAKIYDHRREYRRAKDHLQQAAMLKPLGPANAELIAQVQSKLAQQ